MRFRLRTLLVLAAVGPPVIAVTYFFAARLAQIVAYTQLEDWFPVLKEAAAVSGVIAIVTLAAALCHRMQTTH
jgi:hypothetical protein